MATDLTRAEPAPPTAEPSSQAPLVQPPRANPRPHRFRFGIVYLGLALVLGLGIAGAAVYLTGSLNPGPAWSTWKPSGGGLGAAKQIAAHIAPGYRLPDGNQLVDVIPKGPELSSGGQTVPIPFVVTRGPKGKVDQIAEVKQGDTFTFSFCGLGTACAIATGKPSVQRGTLVRREILEIALYTFKYVRGVKRIVAFMPPPAGSQPTYVVYLQKDDVKEQLKHPLTQTLNGKVPLPNQITSKEQQQVDALTEPHTYKFGVSQTQQGDAVLVLDPLKA